MNSSSRRFVDRIDAGRQLGECLLELQVDDPVVLALPRGGVVVGFEVAKVLRAPLDIIAVRKIGAPAQPELGIGAVVDGGSPELVLDEEMVRLTGTSRSELEVQLARELKELHRRERLYRGDRTPVAVRGRTAIVVDDGIATGSTVRAALRALRRAQPRRLLLAVPVAPLHAVEALREDCDEFVCLKSPVLFRAVGEFYDDFAQTTDQEVIDLLHRASQRWPGARRAVVARAGDKS